MVVLCMYSVRTSMSEYIQGVRFPDVAVTVRVTHWQVAAAATLRLALRHSGWQVTVPDGLVTVTDSDGWFSGFCQSPRPVRVTVTVTDRVQLLAYQVTSPSDRHGRTCDSDLPVPPGRAAGRVTSHGATVTRLSRPTQSSDSDLDSGLPVNVFTSVTS